MYSIHLRRFMVEQVAKANFLLLIRVNKVTIMININVFQVRTTKICLQSFNFCVRMIYSQNSKCNMTVLEVFNYVLFSLFLFQPDVTSTRGLINCNRTCASLSFEFGSFETKKPQCLILFPAHLKQSSLPQLPYSWRNNFLRF